MTEPKRPPPDPAETARDARDLEILRMIDRGKSQEQAARRFGVTRGPITRMLAEIRADLATDPHNNRGKS